MSQLVEQSNWKKLHSKQKSIEKQDSKIDVPELIDSYYFIFDCIENQIQFVNSAFNTITGYSDKDFTIDKLLQIIHPEDLEYFFQSEEKGLHFTNELSFNEHFKYILSYTYRILDSANQPITIQQQCQALEVTSKGFLSKTLVIHKVIADYDTRPTNDYKIFDKNKSVFIDQENRYNLTKRELEILDLICEGLNSVEISERINISRHTIDTHRRNILGKTNSTNFLDLIGKMRKNEFI